jgi:hypothetical protein
MKRFKKFKFLVIFKTSQNLGCYTELARRLFAVNGEVLDIRASGPEEPTVDAGIVHDPLRISGVGGDSPVNVVVKAELPHQRLEVGRPLLEVWMLQLEDDRDVRPDGDGGVGGNDRASWNRAHGTAGRVAAGG